MPTYVPAPADRQRAHIATVMAVAERGPGAAAAARHDGLIRASWQRCVHEHRLDPGRLQEAVILPQARLREHQQQLDSFLSIARHGLESLYAQVAGQGYVVLLTDARGVTVDFIGDLSLEPHLRRAGLYLGSDWSEHHAGTCGVGTCIRTGQALTVHLDDHFDATHIPLTCTAAPIFDTQGRLQAVLDISQLSSGLPKESQHLALQLVRASAAQVEHAAFLQRHRRDAVLRLSHAPQFLAVQPDYLLAVDEDGRIVGHSRAAQQLFEAGAAGLGASLSRPSALIGRPLDTLLALDLETVARLADGRGSPADIGQGGRDAGTGAQPVQRLHAGADGRAQTLYLQAAAPWRPGAGARTRGGLDAAAPGRHTTEAGPLAALSAGDPALDAQLARAARLVDSPLGLLIHGETGSGKEWLARALHAASRRADAPFIAVNCAAIPETLIESELFGHLPGSFSGAGSRGKKGLIQEADGGTLFLDEIGDMPLALQARLLRVLAEREVLPIGATRPVPVRLHVLAATHCALDELVRSGRFREDLYYRLAGAVLRLPPLRERADRLALAERMLADRMPGDADVRDDTVWRLSPEARAAIAAHAWPGNLRELRNAMDYARAIGDGRVLRREDLPEAVQRAGEAEGVTVGSETGGAGGAYVQDPLEAAGRTPWPDAMSTRPPLSPRPASAAPTPAAALADADLPAALAASGGNVSALARQLGCARMTIYRRLRRLGAVTD
jgi:transcriptional regulator of acetoin/glycerol metabolism